LEGEEHHLTHGGRKTQIMADDSLTVVGSQQVTAENHLVSAIDEIHLDAGRLMVLNGTLSTTIKAGGHWLSISPAGIFSSSLIFPAVIPGSGMDVVPAPPVPLSQKIATSGTPSPSFTEVAVQALRDEYISYPSRCEACEAAADEIAAGA